MAKLTKDQFLKSLKNKTPESSFDEKQRALWWLFQNSWDKAHEIVQQHEGESIFDWMHAIVHRLEGDDWNSNYWYKHSGFAGEKNAELSIELDRILNKIV